MPGYSSYRASNSAATKMFEYFGNEHPKMRVVQVHPGLIRTPLSYKFAPSSEGIPWDDGETVSPLSFDVHDLIWSVLTCGVSCCFSGTLWRLCQLDY